jgi:hypothetical protein
MHRLIFKRESIDGDVSESIAKKRRTSFTLSNDQFSRIGLIKNPNFCLAGFRKMMFF